LSKKQKTTKQVLVVGSPIKKKLNKMGLGEMRLGEMLPNRTKSMQFIGQETHTNLEITT